MPPFTGYVPLNNQTSETFNRFLPKIGVTYDMTPNQTVGFTFARGYRQGFADNYPFQGPFFGIYRVAPETLDSYEVSYRSRWLDDTLQLNANFFYYDYTNQQVAFEPRACRVTPSSPTPRSRTLMVLNSRRATASRSGLRLMRLSVCLSRTSTTS